MKQERIKTRILVPLTVAMAVLLGVFLWSDYRNARRRNNMEMDDHLHAAEDLFAAHLREDTNMLSVGLTTMAEDDILRAALDSGDRQALLQRATPLFRKLRQKYHITHFYFTGPDRVNLLRMHQPQRHGDTINRFTTLEAERTGKPASGIELGPLGTFTLRAVHPWYVGERLIGYVELGEEIDHITKAVCKILDVELHTIIKKEFLDRQRWEEGMEMLGFRAQWDQFPDSVIVSQRPILPGYSTILAQRQQGDIHLDYHLDSGGRIRRVGFLPLGDAGNRTVGELAMEIDVTEKLAASGQSVRITAVICVVIGASLFVFFHKFLGRVERDLFTARRKATEETHSREEAQTEHTEELRKTRDQLQAVVDGIPSPLMVIDRDYKIVLANRVVREHTGGIDPAAHGLTCHQVSHHQSTPCEGTNDPCPLRKAVEERTAVTVTHVHSDADGTRHIVDVTASPIFDENGEVVQIIESCYDVTDRVQASEALRLQSGALESAANAIMITDRGGSITWVNPAFSQLTGFSLEEVAGRNPHLLRSGKQGDEFYSDLWETIIGGKVWQGEMIDRRQDGSLYTVETTITPVPDEQGEISHFVAIQQDITERKRTEAELKEAKQAAENANQAKSEFLANMSHEIRTPMTAILGFADNLLDDDLPQSQRADTVETIRRNGQHLLKVINDILDISKIEAGKISSERITCSPLQLVAEVKSLLQARATAKGLDLQLEFTGALPETIQTDPARLRQILVNLIDNAVKFTNSGSVRLITQFVEQQQPALEFNVVDTGIGMDARQADHIFLPFTQADGSMARKFGGTGLGLTLSKRMAEMLDGDVVLADSQPGVGSRFRLTIATGPLDGVEMIEDPASMIRPNAESPAPAAPPNRLDCRILLAEDGRDNQRIISIVLKKAGAEVEVVENGQLAVDAALKASQQGNSFDVILMDMQMPVMDGYEATSLLRARGYTGPIVALTAHAMAGDRQKCLDAGCSEYATKPIDRAKLIETVRKQLAADPAASKQSVST